MCWCPIGMPSSLPRALPAIMRASAARASDMARSSVNRMKLCSTESRLRIRARQWCVSSSGESLRDAISRDASEIVRNSSISEILRLEGMRRLGLTRKHRRADTREHPFHVAPRAVDLGELRVRQCESRAPDQHFEILERRIRHSFTFQQTRLFHLSAGPQLGRKCFAGALPDLLVNEADYLLDRLLSGRRRRIPHDEPRLRPVEYRQIHFASLL